MQIMMTFLTVDPSVPLSNFIHQDKTSFKFHILMLSWEKDWPRWKKNHHRKGKQGWVERTELAWTGECPTMCVYPLLSHPIGTATLSSSSSKKCHRSSAFYLLITRPFYLHIRGGIWRIWQCRQVWMYEWLSEGGTSRSTYSTPLHRLVLGGDSTDTLYGFYHCQGSAVQRYQHIVVLIRADILHKQIKHLICVQEVNRNGTFRVTHCPFPGCSRKSARTHARMHACMRAQR